MCVCHYLLVLELVDVVVIDLSTTVGSLVVCVLVTLASILLAMVVVTSGEFVVVVVLVELFAGVILDGLLLLLIESL